MSKRFLPAYVQLKTATSDKAEQMKELGAMMADIQEKMKLQIY